MNTKILNIPGFNPNPVGIGEKLRNRRLELRLLQKDVAKVFDVSEESIVNWENSNSEMQLQFYPKLIEFLGYFPFEIDSITIAGKIKKYRYLNGLSCKELGKIIGVDTSTIRSWEYEKTTPSKGALKRLNDILTTYENK